MSPSVLLSRRFAELCAAVNEVEEIVKKAKSAIRVVEISLSQTRQLMESFASVRVLAFLDSK